MALAQTSLKATFAKATTTTVGRVSAIAAPSAASVPP